MKKIFYITSIGIFSILSSCSSVVGVAESKIGKQQPSLSNTRWEVIGNLKTNARPYISFDPETGMNGNGGCNRIFSQNVIIKSQHGDFSIKNIGITRMACPSMNMNVETNFVKMLESANKYVVDKNTLELYKGNMLLIKLHKN